jgi:hypothetical protein
MKRQFYMMGEWITVRSISFETIADVTFLAMHVEDFPTRRLKSLVDWVSRNWKSDIVAVVNTERGYIREE